MAQTLRLLRYGLLIRVGLTIIEAILSAQQSSIGPWMRLTADLPYLVALALVLLYEWRNWQSVRALSNMLAAMMCIYAAEVLILATLTLLSGGAMGTQNFAALVLDRMYHRDDSGLLTGSLSANAYSTMPIMVSIIPPLLGTWLGGQRSVVRWAGLAVGVDMISRISVTFVLGTALPLRVQVFDFLTYATVVTMMCAFAGSLAEREREEQRQLQAANRLLAEQAHTQQQLAASRERVRMARDLHDTLAHTLAALTVQLQTVDAALDNPEPVARQLLARASEQTEEGLQNARNAIMDLRSTQVKDMGLVAALQQQIDVLTLHSGCEIVLQASAEVNLLTDEVAETLFRIAQEALNNVIRHARASHAVVSVTMSATPPRLLTLLVQDDGQGFDVSQRDEQRFGLRGMRERADLINAHLQISGIRGHGTTVKVVLELPEEKGNDENTRARGG